MALACGEADYRFACKRRGVGDGRGNSALREGVVLAYDRNEKTIGSFARSGFSIVEARILLNELRRVFVQEKSLSAMETHRDSIAGASTVILIPSGELSRARGGSHCLSMPLNRSKIGTTAVAKKTKKRNNKG